MPLEPTRPLTRCEKNRKTAQASNNFGRMVPLPECTERGEYKRMQCQSQPGIGDCWCVGPDGIQIPGTKIRGPRTPDCAFGMCHYLTN